MMLDFQDYSFLDLVPLVVYLWKPEDKKCIIATSHPIQGGVEVFVEFWSVRDLRKFTRVRRVPSITSFVFDCVGVEHSTCVEGEFHWRSFGCIGPTETSKPTWILTYSTCLPESIEKQRKCGTAREITNLC